MFSHKNKKEIINISYKNAFLILSINSVDLLVPDLTCLPDK